VPELAEGTCLLNKRTSDGTKSSNLFLTAELSLGNVAERLIALHSNWSRPKGLGGSNPPISASKVKGDVPERPKGHAWKACKGRNTTFRTFESFHHRHLLNQPVLGIDEPARTQLDSATDSICKQPLFICGLDSRDNVPPCFDRHTAAYHIASFLFF
jgi:hypothetical protein